MDSINLGEAPIKILVGPGEKCLFVHSATLETSSEFFKAALKKDWREGQQREIKFPAEDPQVFDIYAKWLYSGNIVLKYEPEGGNLDTLTKLYAVGERVLDVIFQDHVINAIVGLTRTADKITNTRYLPGKQNVNRTYESTPENSPLRRLMVDFYVVSSSSEWAVALGGLEDFDDTFARDLAMALLKRKWDAETYNEGQRQVLQKSVPCAYHKHDEDKACGGEVMQKFFQT